MSVTFIPSSQGVIQCADTEWPTIGGFNTDTAVVLMRGPRTKIVAYLDTLVRWTKLSGYPYMYLDNWEEGNMTASFPSVALRYTGVRVAQAPPFKLENDLTTATASATGTDEAPGSPTFGQTISGTVVYTASRSTWSWFEFVSPPNSPPTSPPAPYNAVNQGVSPQPFGYSIQAVVDPDTGRVIPVTTSAFTALINSLVETELVADYTRELIIPGYLWACKSVVQVQLEST